MSSGIWQRGEEEEGVYGFLIEDIRKEVNRASKLVSKLLYSLSVLEKSLVVSEEEIYGFSFMF